MADPILDILAGKTPTVDPPVKKIKTSDQYSQDELFLMAESKLKPIVDKEANFADRIDLTPELRAYKNEGLKVTPDSVKGRLQETAYQSQDYWDRLGNSLKISGANAISTFIGGMLEIPQIAQNNLSDNEFGMLSPIAEWRNSVQEENTSFRTPVDDSQGIGGYLLPSWYSGSTESVWGSALESAGYGIGAIGSTLVQEAMVTAITGGTGTLPLLGKKLFDATRYLTKVAKLEKLADTLQAGSKAYNTLKAAQAFNIGTNIGKNVLRSAYSSYVESAFEALEGRDRVKEKLVEEYTKSNGYEPTGDDLALITKKAQDASDTRFWANYIGLTLTNMPFSKAMFSSFDKALTLKDTFKDLGVKLGKDGKLVDDVITLSGDFWQKNMVTKALKSPAEFLINKGKNASISWSEGLEEGYQMMVEKGTENYFTHDYDIEANDTLFGGIAQGIKSVAGGANAVMSEEGIKSMLSGVLGGTYQGAGAWAFNRAMGNTSKNKLDRNVGEVWVKEGDKYTKKQQTYRQYIESQAQGIGEFSKELVNNALDPKTYKGTFASQLTDYQRQIASVADMMEMKGKLEHKQAQNAARFHSILPYVSKGYKDILIDKIIDDVNSNDTIQNKDKVIQDLTSDIQLVDKYYQRMQETFTNPYSQESNPTEYGMYEHLKNIGTYHLFHLEQNTKAKEDILNFYGNELVNNPVIKDIVEFWNQASTGGSPKVYRDRIAKIYDKKIKALEKDLELASKGEAILDTKSHREKIAALKKIKKELGLVLNERGWNKEKDADNSKFSNRFKDRTFGLIDKVYEFETGKPLLNPEIEGFDNYQDILSNIFHFDSLTEKIQETLSIVKDLSNLSLKTEQEKLEWLYKYAEKARDIAETKADFKSQLNKFEALKMAEDIIENSDLTEEAKEEAVKKVEEVIESPQTTTVTKETVETIVEEVAKTDAVKKENTPEKELEKTVVNIPVVEPVQLATKEDLVGNVNLYTGSIPVEEDYEENDGYKYDYNLEMLHLILTRLFPNKKFGTSAEQLYYADEDGKLDDIINFINKHYEKLIGKIEFDSFLKTGDITKHYDEETGVLSNVEYPLVQKPGSRFKIPDFDNPVLKEIPYVKFNQANFDELRSIVPDIFIEMEEVPVTNNEIETVVDKVSNEQPLDTKEKEIITENTEEVADKIKEKANTTINDSGHSLESKLLDSIWQLDNNHPDKIIQRNQEYSEETFQELEEYLQSRQGILSGEDKNSYLSNLDWKIEVPNGIVGPTILFYDIGLERVTSPRIIQGRNKSGDVVITVQDHILSISEVMFIEAQKLGISANPSMALKDFMKIITPEQYEIFKNLGLITFKQDYTEALRLLQDQENLYESLERAIRGEESIENVIDKNVDRLELIMTGIQSVGDKRLDTYTPFNFLEYKGTIINKPIIQIKEDGSIVAVRGDLNTIYDFMDYSPLASPIKALEPGYYTLFTFSKQQLGTVTPSVFAAKLKITANFEDFNSDLKDTLNNLTIDSFKELKQKYTIAFQSNEKNYLTDINLESGKVSFSLYYDNEKGDKVRVVSEPVNIDMLKTLDSYQQFKDFVESILPDTIGKIDTLSIFYKKKDISESAISNNLDNASVNFSFSKVFWRVQPKQTSDEGGNYSIMEAEGTFDVMGPDGVIAEYLPTREEAEKVIEQDKAQQTLSPQQQENLDTLIGYATNVLGVDEKNAKERILNSGILFIKDGNEFISENELIELIESENFFVDLPGDTPFAREMFTQEQQTVLDFLLKNC